MCALCGSAPVRIFGSLFRCCYGKDFRDGESLGLFIKIQLSASITRASSNRRSAARYMVIGVVTHRCTDVSRSDDGARIRANRNDERRIRARISLTLRGRATDSSGAADKPAASVERSSTGMFCLTMYEVRCTNEQVQRYDTH